LEVHHVDRVLTVEQEKPSSDADYGLAFFSNPVGPPSEP
jgi:hypothetical protein